MIQQDPNARPNDIAEVKKELMARKNDFVLLQEVKGKKSEGALVFDSYPSLSRQVVAAHRRLKLGVDTP
jgi:hypothetical protein